MAPTREDYSRWIWEMGRLGVSTVRVYTILRPSFYDALRAYDLGQSPNCPIRLIQGVWSGGDHKAYRRTDRRYIDAELASTP